MGRLAGCLALPAYRLLLHHRYSRPIHLHIQDGNRLARHEGQVELEGFPALFLLAPSDIGAEGLGGPLHRFGGHLQVGEQFHLLPTVIEGRLLAYDRLHATHARRKLRIFDVQPSIDRELAAMAARAQLVGTRHFHRAQRREHGPGSQLVVVREVAASTRNRPLVGCRGWELQKFGEGGSPRPMQGRAHRHFHGLQIDAAVFAPLSKEATQELVYFPRHLLMDRSSRFFSSAVHVPASSTGRRRQIFSFTAISSALSL
jgi:hypothetical protein